MKIEQIKEIADAVLYEGYLLYPYRHSALKNRQRWTFGVVYPRAYSEAQGTREAWLMQTECLVAGQAETSLTVSVRFLHLLMHTCAQKGDQDYETWDEGIAREVIGKSMTLGELAARPHTLEIVFAGGDSTERASPDMVLWQPIAGTVTVTATQIGTELFRLRVVIENNSVLDGTLLQRRDAVLMQSFVSTHTILQVQQGSFISLLEPADELLPLAQSCQNLHTWPVLVGDAGEHDALLSSPIILYDYPQIAPESPGSFFDGSEIDEMLALRVLTLTDEEKLEMQAADEQTRTLLERTEQLSSEQLMKLHGVIRSLRPVDDGVKH